MPGGQLNARGTIQQRMLSAASVDSETGCWVWGKARNSRGYGVIWFEGSLKLAHRVAFRLDRGRWPDQDLVTDEICENKACVNPAHLRELTNAENIGRARQ